MIKQTARIRPEQTNSGGKEVYMDRPPSWTSVPRDEVYEQRIFELECQIQQLEYLLMVTECERNQYKHGQKRQACA